MQLNLLSTAPQAATEVVERKGTGHPDSLSDGLAEALSRDYSNYTRETFGAVLHHNFDKVGLLGGQAAVNFGDGRVTGPVRVLVNGRASSSFAGEAIPVRELVSETTRRFLTDRLPKLDPDCDLQFLWNLSAGSSPGQVDAASEEHSVRRRWFMPRSLADLPELHRLVCNDTSVGAAFAPLSSLERFVLEVENGLHGDGTMPWLGTDIKILALRHGNEVRLTMCLPQIADEVSSLPAYIENIESARLRIFEVAQQMMPDCSVSLDTNTRDDTIKPELYLTATGSSIESGDEGLVGRGNRANGLIATNRPYTMEGVCGKNPVYHTGKIYTVAAQRIADTLHASHGGYFGVWVLGQAGRSLDDPWQVTVAHDSPVDDGAVESVVKTELAEVGSITEDLLLGAVRLY